MSFFGLLKICGLISAVFHCLGTCDWVITVASGPVYPGVVSQRYNAGMLSRPSKVWCRSFKMLKMPKSFTMSWLEWNVSFRLETEYCGSVETAAKYSFRSSALIGDGADLWAFWLRCWLFPQFVCSFLWINFPECWYRLGDGFCYYISNRSCCFNLPFLINWFFLHRRNLI